MRGADVFVVQSMTTDINFHIMELLLMADAFKRASANRIPTVVPYYAYARQDRKDRPRVPISARLVADLLQTAGFTRLLAIDLHANQIQGFFNIPVDNLMALPIFIPYFQSMNLAGRGGGLSGCRRCRTGPRLFPQTRGGTGIADKRRAEANVAEIMHIIGESRARPASLSTTSSIRPVP